jgi:hypothetical protein
MKSVCDFCYSPDPVWEFILPTDAVRLIAQIGEDTSMIDTGEWLACSECKSCIERGWVNGLATRGVSLNPDFKRAIEARELSLLTATRRAMNFCGLWLRLWEGTGRHGKPYKEEAAGG